MGSSSSSCSPSAADDLRRACTRRKARGGHGGRKEAAAVRQGSQRSGLAAAKPRLCPWGTQVCSTPPSPAGWAQLLKLGWLHTRSSHRACVHVHAHTLLPESAADSLLALPCWLLLACSCGSFIASWNLRPSLDMTSSSCSTKGGAQRAQGAEGRKEHPGAAGKQGVTTQLAGCTATCGGAGAYGAALPPSTPVTRLLCQLRHHVPPPPLAGLPSLFRSRLCSLWLLAACCMPPCLPALSIAGPTHPPHLCQT